MPSWGALPEPGTGYEVSGTSHQQGAVVGHRVQAVLEPRGAAAWAPIWQPVLPTAPQVSADQPGCGTQLCPCVCAAPSTAQPCFPWGLQAQLHCGGTCLPCLSLSLPSKDIDALHCWLCPQVAPGGTESRPRGGGGRRVWVGAVTVPSCPHAWPAPCRHFPGQKAVCPPRAADGDKDSQPPPGHLPVTAHQADAPCAVGRLLYGDHVGVQTLGGPGLTRWHVWACRRCSHSRGKVLWVPGLAAAARGRRWDVSWVAPRKLPAQVSS